MLNHDPQLPNILFLVTDQQRHDAVGWVNPNVNTPNLNKLAAKSIICTNTYVQSPQCQPSRASILTGKYPTAHQVWWNQVPLLPRHKVITQFLDRYNTAWFGKLDLMKRSQFGACYLFEDWRSDCKPEINNEFDGVMNSKTWTGNCKYDRSLYHEDVITVKAVEHLATVKSPWFIGVSYYGPHPPYMAAKPFNSQYNVHNIKLSNAILEGRTQHNHAGHILTTSEWRLLISQYYGQISWIDDNIGRLLKIVGDDTIIIFMSDHGDILGDHGLFSKGVYAYEGNTRIPLLLRLPFYEPMKYDGLVQAIDVLPTLLKYLNINASAGIQGRSLLDAFCGGPGNEWALSMIGRDPRLRMLRYKNYKYWSMKREEKVFDLDADPEEEHDLSWNSELIGMLRGMMVQALIEAEDPLPLPTKHG